MSNLPIQGPSINARIIGIERNLVVLKKFAQLSEEEFARDEIQDRAQHLLRLTVEGMLNIASHLISRFPGGRETQYKNIMAKLADIGIFDRAFVEETLVPIAGYRNRLTHLYAQVTSNELRGILQRELGDIEKFLDGIKLLMQDPAKFGLTVA